MPVLEFCFLSNETNHVSSAACSFSLFFLFFQVLRIHTDIEISHDGENNAHSKEENSEQDKFSPLGKKKEQQVRRPQTLSLEDFSALPSAF